MSKFSIKNPVSRPKAAGKNPKPTLNSIQDSAENLTGSCQDPFRIRFRFELDPDLSKPIGTLLRSNQKPMGTYLRRFAQPIISQDYGSPDNLSAQTFNLK
jgi:hypothetical protein